jgi:hypothetical protein
MEGRFVISFAAMTILNQLLKLMHEPPEETANKGEAKELKLLDTEMTFNELKNWQETPRVIFDSDGNGYWQKVTTRRHSPTPGLPRRLPRDSGLVQAKLVPGPFWRCYVWLGKNLDLPEFIPCSASIAARSMLSNGEDWRAIVPERAAVPQFLPPIISLRQSGWPGHAQATVQTCRTE